LLTGAASGIGRAMAIELAKEGAKLIVADRNIEELKRLKDECLLYTSFCEILPFDLSVPEK
jgi:dehydrogenase/reductase SDR family member 7B